jgi:hypothetical protein
VSHLPCGDQLDSDRFRGRSLLRNLNHHSLLREAYAKQRTISSLEAWELIRSKH